LTLLAIGVVHHDISAGVNLDVCGEPANRTLIEVRKNGGGDMERFFEAWEGL
jgi:hypothetical protein